jgi:AsmA protein
LKAVKYILAALAGLVVLAGALAVFVAASFDPNKYKPEIISLVKDKTGRTLAIDGSIELSFFPRIGVNIGKLTLSEPGKAKLFASVDEAKVSLNLMPLLSRQVEVDRVLLSGLKVDLEKFKDGHSNFDDLTGGGGAAKPKDKSEGTDSKPFKIDIDGISLKDATVGWRDDAAGTQFTLSGMQLTTTRIASGVPGKLEFAAAVQGAKPRLSVQVKLATGYRVDFASGAIALSGIDFKVTGDAPGAAGLSAAIKGDVEFDPAKKRVSLSSFDLSASTRDGMDVKLAAPKLLVSPDEASSAAVTGQVKLAKTGQTVDAKFVLAALEARGKKLSTKLDVDFSVKQGDQSTQGKLSSPVSIDLDAQSAQLTRLAADVAIPSPVAGQKSMSLANTGSVRVDWGKQVVVSELVTRVDESTIQSKLNVAGFSAPAIGFDIAIDKLNVDKYLPPSPPPAKGATAPAPAAAEKPIDLSGLRGLNLNGSLRVGSLQVHQVKLEKLQLGLRAAGGKLDINPLSASLYQGTLAGSASVNANGNQFSARQQLAGVALGPLLRDAIGKDMLEGKGNVQLDVQTTGVTVGALKKALGGTASVNLKDGAIKGINLAETFRKAKAALGAKGATEQGANKADKTDFSEMSASFVIRGGVAHNEDLSAKSPFLRLGGAGDINIGNDSMDYLAKAAIVNTSGGQGGKDLDSMKGLTVPVHLSGSFDALKYKIDFGAMLTDQVKQQVQQKVQEKVKDQLGDKLKGLFKR